MFNYLYKAGLFLLAGIIFSPLCEAQKTLSNEEVFTLLEKKAVVYERKLKEKFGRGLSEYIPKEKYHMSILLYWRPDILTKLVKQIPEKEPEGVKLPGYSITVQKKGDEETAKTRLGSENLLKLQVNILLDNSLPHGYVEFIKNFIPAQSEFIAERGDSVVISPIRFPDSKYSFPEGELVAFDQDLVASLRNTGNEPDAIRKVIEKAMLNYERQVKNTIGATLIKYVNPEDFIINVTIYWSEDAKKKIKNILFLNGTPSEIKMPGFDINMKKKKKAFEYISNARNLFNLNITVLLNEKNVKGTQDFFAKAIPLTVNLHPERGDVLTFIFTDFPKKNTGEEAVPALTNTSVEDTESGMIESNDEILVTDAENAVENSVENSALDLRISMILLEARQHYFDGDLKKTLMKVNYALKLNPNSAKAYEMLGSVYYRLNWNELAEKSWRRSLELEPNNKTIRRYLN